MKQVKLGIISLVFLIALAFAVSAETCYNSVQSMPATCEGASISSDTWDGGRHITCGSMTVAAWDKTGFFEMYKQSGGSDVRICIGSTCIKESGYAKSTNFPICVGGPVCTPSNEVCDGVDNDCDGQVDEGNVCPICTVIEMCNGQDDDCDGQVDEGDVCASANQTCYAKVNDLPVTCTGGAVTTDNKGGCRTVVCTSGSSSMQAMACDKPTSSSPTFYEVYNQGKTGTAVSKICFGSACVDGTGYAKANFPYCTASNGTNPPGDVSVTLQLIRGFPHDQNAAFQCIPNGFNATNYTFNFGDGSSESRPVFDIYHTYATNGTYTVSCTARDSTKTATNTLQVPIIVSPIPTQERLGAQITELSRDGDTVTFACQTAGYESQLKKWFVSDDPRFIGQQHGTGNTLTYTFNSSGDYRVDCDAYYTGDVEGPIQHPRYYDYGTSTYHNIECRQGWCTMRTDSHVFNMTVGSNQTLPNQTTCYNTLNDLPANCTGTITSDVKGAGRTISCAGSNGNIQVQAWEKTHTQGRFFEINRQSYSGTPPTVCIGKDCLKPGWGYQKGGYYPICMSTTNTTPPNSTNQTNPPNSTNSSDPGASSSLSLVSGTVNGQSISPSQRVVTVPPGAAISGAVQLAYTNAWPASISVPLGATRNWDNQQTGYLAFGDATGGGKTVNITYAAPIYPGDYAITFAYRAETTTAHVFSMTNWAREPLWYDGNDVAQWSSAQITAANTNGRVTAPVLFTDGYKNVSVPATAIIIRVSNNIPPQNTSGANVTVIADVTAEHNVVFRCDPGFNATQYFWTFSDGTSFNKTNSSGYQRMETYPNVYHTFPGNGTYTATCTATNGNRTASGSKQVTVSTRATPAQIAQTPIFNMVDITHMGGNTFNIACDAVGANDFAADWILTGNGLWYMPNGYWSRNLTFTFNEQKNYTGGCTTAMPFSMTPQYFNEGHLSGGCSAPYLCSVGTAAAYSGFGISVPHSDDINLHGGIYAKQIDDLKYEFWCNMPSFGGPYDADFGDGNHTYQLAARFNHTYAAPGNYSISCHYDASPGYGGVQASWWTGSSVQVTNGSSPFNASASIAVAPWYPQGRDYVFQCRAQGFNATRYDYSFGDGQLWQDVEFDNTYHAYANAGTYNVSCTAENDAVSRSASMMVTVS